MSVHVYLGSMYIPVYKCMCMHTNIHASQLCTQHAVVRSLDQGSDCFVAE